jgi:hypothetical protein
MYRIGVFILLVAQAIALSKRGDDEEPMTNYIRRFFKLFGAVGAVLIPLAILAWLGCHFILDTDGSLAC